MSASQVQLKKAWWEPVQVSNIFLDCLSLYHADGPTPGGCCFLGKYLLQKTFDCMMWCIDHAMAAYCGISITILRLSC